jgi:hypothetical protein
MFSQNPRADQFKIIIPDDFYVQEITDKYNDLLQQKPFIINNISDLLEESIKTFDTPEFGVNLLEQTAGNLVGISNVHQQLPKQSLDKATEKTFSITFRHTDGYLTYFMMLEHFFYRYKMGKNQDRKNFGTVIVELSLPNGIAVCRLKLNRVNLIGVPALSLDYSNPARDQSMFTCTFGYDTFETTFELPKIKKI